MNIPKLYKFVKALLQLSNISSDKGTLVYDTENIEVGIDIFVESVDGLLVPAEDGEYTTEKLIIGVEGGKVVSIKDVVEPEPEPEPVEPEELEVETPVNDDKIAELESIIAEKDNKIADLEKEIEELKAKLEEPVADPAEEELKQKEKFNKTTSFEFKHRSVK